MKALEILKEFKQDSDAYLKSFGENGTIDEDFVQVKEIHNKIIEAIRELEELNNRSCSNCQNAYYQDVTNDLDDDIYTCDEFESDFINIGNSGRPKDFYCNRYKLKD